MVPVTVQQQVGDVDRSQYFPGVQPEMLTVIEDGTMANRSAAPQSYLHMIQLLHSTPPEKFEEFLKGKPENTPLSFAQLFQQASHYRGKLIRIRSTAKAAFPQKFRKNDVGIENYFEIILETPEKYIIKAYVLELPTDFPLSKVHEDRSYDQINAEVELVGFFYKQVAYHTQEDLSLAPLILAANLIWNKPKPAEEKVELTWADIATYVVGALLFGVGLAAMLIWQSGGWIRHPVRERREPTPEELANLAHQTLVLDSPPTAADFQTPASPPTPSEKPKEESS